MRRLDSINLNGHTVTGNRADVWNNGQLFLSLNSGGEQAITALPGTGPGTINYGSYNGVFMSAPVVPTDNYILTIFDGRAPVYVNKGSGVGVTLPKTFPKGYKAVVIQQGAGQITFSPESGATLHGLSSATKTSGQYARATLEIISNTDGASAVWTLAGDVSP